MKAKNLRNYKRTIDEARQQADLSQLVEEYDKLNEQWYCIKTVIEKMQIKLNNILIK